MIHGVVYRTSKYTALRSEMEHCAGKIQVNPRLHLLTTSQPQCWLAQEIDTSVSTLVGDDNPPHVFISAWARLDNCFELAERLHIASNIVPSLSSRQLILQAYLRFGESCTQYLYGDFSFAIYDAAKHLLFCARDHMGILPFYYYIDQDIFIFSSSMALFHHIPGLTLQPSRAWTSRLLLHDVLCMDFEKTAYDQILKLAPAHQLCIRPDQHTKNKYFSFHTEKVRFNSSDAYIEYYHHHLDNAIKCRVQEHHPIGAELSGGLDSSTVTAYAIKHYPGTLDHFHTFSYAIFADEPRHIHSMIQHLNISKGHISHDTTPIFSPDPMRALTTIGAPAQYRCTTRQDTFYDLMTRHFNVRTLLSGFGGDEFVTSMYGYLALYELMKHKRYHKLYQILQGNAMTRALRLLKFSYRYWQNPCVQHHHKDDMFRKRWPLHLVRDEVIQAYDLKNRFDNLTQFDQGYDNLDRFILENRLAPFISTRTEEGSLVAASYGMKYCWPLLDVRLIQCFLSIPSEEKHYRGIGRYLHKRAVKHMLPANIVQQPSKYMGRRQTALNTSMCQPNDDLHPMLLSLINTATLYDQTHTLKHRKASLSDSETLCLSFNIIRVNKIDHWLKHYFPHRTHFAENEITKTE